MDGRSNAMIKEREWKRMVGAGWNKVFTVKAYGHWAPAEGGWFNDGFCIRNYPGPGNSVVIEGRAPGNKLWATKAEAEAAAARASAGDTSGMELASYAPFSRKEDQ
jgi:hypothetical protein